MARHLSLELFSTRHGAHLLVIMVDENEEEDEADQSGHEGQEAEEEALRGPDAVRLRVGRHLAAGHAHAVVVLTVVPEVIRGHYADHY